MSGVTVVHVLWGHLRNVDSGNVISCGEFVVVHPFPLFKILICQFCPHGNCKTTQASPGKARDVFLLLSLGAQPPWLPLVKSGNVEMVVPVHAAFQSAHPRTAVLNREQSSPEEKCLLRRQSEQSLRSQWGLAVSGRKPGCKYSFFKDLISCYVLTWLLEWSGREKDFSKDLHPD